MRTFKPLLVVGILIAALAGGWLLYTGYFSDAPQQSAQGGPSAGQAAPGGGPGARGPRGGRGGRVQPVYAERVKVDELGDRIEAIGTLQANESITITTQAQGVIREINFADGQAIKEGEAIASVDSGEEDARVAVEMANLDEQRKQLGRVTDLVKNKNASQAMLDQQTAALRKAEANVAAARARAGDFRIIAPFSGVLGTRRVSVGALVSPGTVVTTLDDISEVKLDFAVPENFLSAVRPDLNIEATSVAYKGQVFKGRVIAVDTRIDPTTRSVAVRAAIPNDELRLRPGMLMVVDLITNTRQAMMIPEQALNPEMDKQFVFLVGSDNIAHKVEVVLGQRRLGLVEILEGISETDLVVTEGTQELTDGGRVEVLNSEVLREGAATVRNETRAPT